MRAMVVGPHCDLIRQEDQRLVAVGDLHDDAARAAGPPDISSASAGPSKAIRSSATTPPRVGTGRAVDHVVVRVGAEARDEDHARAVQLREPGVIDVAHVEHQHRARAQTSAAAPPVMSWRLPSVITSTVGR